VKVNAKLKNYAAGTTAEFSWSRFTSSALDGVYAWTVQPTWGNREQGGAQSAAAADKAIEDCKARMRAARDARLKRGAEMAPIERLLPAHDPIQFGQDGEYRWEVARYGRCAMYAIRLPNGHVQKGQSADVEEARTHIDTLINRARKNQK